jgi:hypothetical protein
VGAWRRWTGELPTSRTRTLLELGCFFNVISCCILVVELYAVFADLHVVIAASDTATVADACFDSTHFAHWRA